MGKGDKKTGKGKRFRGSYGKTRPRKSAAPVIEAKPKAKKKKVTPKTTAKAEAKAETKTTAKKAPAKKTTAKKEKSEA